MKQSFTDRIASIIGNQPLATSLVRSIDSALQSDSAHIPQGKNVWEIFQRSLNSAIRDIEYHPQGKLFQRMIEYGPYPPDYPYVAESDGVTTLSDPECGNCVEFVYSHMINRFKGELAELLALEPCLNLLDRLHQYGRLPPDIHLYFGDIIQQKRRKKIGGEQQAQIGAFTKGADGLLVQVKDDKRSNPHDLLFIQGIIEVKSDSVPQETVLRQMSQRIGELGEGLKLDSLEYSSEQLSFREVDLLRIMVVPSRWKLSRSYERTSLEDGTRLVIPEPTDPVVETTTEELKSGFWKITLAWSQEALSQAAYNMTLWYWSQVGKHIYSIEPLPKGWEGMTPHEAGTNAIKMMLYYLPLRGMTERQKRLAVRLYNVYSFGYVLGVESKEMLWPEYFPVQLEICQMNYLQKTGRSFKTRWLPFSEDFLIARYSPTILYMEPESKKPILMF